VERINLENRINELEAELKALKRDQNALNQGTKTVNVPDEFSPVFENIEQRIRTYFEDLNMDPESGEITANGQRYLLLRTDSMSHEFLDFIISRYSDRPQAEAVSIGNNFQYDNAKVIGTRDAIAFHQKLNLKEPIEKLSAGPIHFAFTGWANVEIFPESNPDPGDNFVLKFQHHNSWEAQSWLKAGKKSEIPVCTMNCGYSAGWCEESFSISLTTVEVTCEAKGDDACTFIMAPTDKIEKYVEEVIDLGAVENFEIPVFFRRKHIEEELKKSLRQKEHLIQEIHHRVKNNLQVISSLLRLQMDSFTDDDLKGEFLSSINRANAMAAVHELMYQRNEFKEVRMDVYFDELFRALIALYQSKDNIGIELDINIPEVQVNLEKSIPLALILNEITCNSFKHGLKHGGTFYLRLLEKEVGSYCLIVGDTGTGMDPATLKAGLGMDLINILVEQIGGEQEIINSKSGLEYKIYFNLDS
jgi:two-component sensor histidine kinase